MNRTLAKEITSVSNRVASDAREFTRSISKSISKLDLDRMYNEINKSVRVALKKGNRRLNKSIRTFKRTETFKAITNLPVYLTELRGWSAVQMKQARRLSRLYARMGRKLLRRNMPTLQLALRNLSSELALLSRSQLKTVRKIVRNTYPKLEYYITGKPTLRYALANFNLR